MYKNSYLIHKVSFIIILVLVSFSSIAQYTVSGQVLDENGVPLIGANVFIKGTTHGTSTNYDGFYKLEHIKTSSIELNASFLGYDLYAKQMELQQAVNMVNIKLTSLSQTIDQVVVKAETEGQTKAMISQQKAENIKNVVSAEQIENFPDMNAAEAMQRITGITLKRDQGEGKFIQLRGTPPEFTNFNVNGEQIPSPEGNVRYVGMDIISADQIETIEVTKVLTPDMDGDGIAGSVNIVTKKAKSEDPEIKASIATGYSNLRGTPNYNMQLSYGARKNKLGFQVSGSYYQNEQGSDDLEAKFIKGSFWDSESQGEGVDNYHVMYQDLQLRYYETLRKRTGLSATLDYEFNKKHNIYLKGMYNQFSDEQTRSRKTYDLEDAADINNYLYGSVKHDVKYRTKDQQVNTLNFGGEDVFKFLKIDYELAYAQAKENTPDQIETQFSNVGHALVVRLDRDGTTFPKPIFDDPEDDSIASDYKNFEFDGLKFTECTVNDENYTAKLNLKIPIKTAVLPGEGYIKFGGKARQKNKSRDEEVKSYSSYDNTWISSIYPTSRPRQTLTLTDISSGVKTTNLLKQGYVVEQIPDPQKMRDFYNYNAFLFYYGDQYDTESRDESLVADYEATELITAFYAMVHYDYAKFTIVGGVRFENTAVDYTVDTVIKNSRNYFDTSYVVSNSQKHNFILPNFQIKYTPADRLNIRAAYTSSFARPNFEDVLPTREGDRDDIKYGNPDLEYPLSKNIDLMAEKYLNHDGLLSAGLYYKNIDNFIIPYRIHAYDKAVGSHVDVEIPINGKKADVFGIELQAQFKFKFLEETSLPLFLSNMGIYSNYAFTYSDAIMYKRLPANYSADTIDMSNGGINDFFNKDDVEHINLPGQTKHSVNLALFYEGKKFYAKLSANYHDKYLNQAGNDADLDEYVDKAWHLDFTTSYTINKTIKCFVDVMNILDTPKTMYLGSSNYLQQQEYYSWWGRVGIKFNY